MGLIRKFFRWLLYIFIIPASYIIISFILGTVIIDRKENTLADKTIYLSTNGVHLDIVFPRDTWDGTFISGLKLEEKSQFLSIGWGDENFYLNTPTWNDLTFTTAFSAMFLKSRTLMHVTKYENSQSHWVEVRLSGSELRKLKNHIANTFYLDNSSQKLLLPNKGYSTTDEFYKAHGSYSCFHTCNSWVNSAFKESGLKSCLWTPFDFSLLDKYE